MADDISQLPTIYLFRTGETFSNSGAMGERGILVVGEQCLHTIERGGRHYRLQKGLFLCSMYETKKIGQGFYISATGEYGHNRTLAGGGPVEFMIHAANYPNEVEGCIAPGQVKLTNGVASSKAAMRDLFNFCGGWSPGKKLMLDVDNID